MSKGLCLKVLVPKKEFKDQNAKLRKALKILLGFSKNNECFMMEFCYQQDNAPIHVARSSLNYFKERNIPLFQNWPAKSPDMNIIENVWSILSRKVYDGGRQYDNIEDLVAAIETGWKSIDQATIQGLYIGLQRRMMALYHDARGKSRRY